MKRFNIENPSIEWISSQKTPQVFSLNKELPSSASKISFWNDILPLSDDNADIYEKNIFTIKDIEVIDNFKILYFNSALAILADEWASIEFKIGMSVSIICCLCCEDKKNLCINEKEDMRNLCENVLKKSKIMNNLQNNSFNSFDHSSFLPINTQEIEKISNNIFNKDSGSSFIINNCEKDLKQSKNYFSKNTKFLNTDYLKNIFYINHEHNFIIIEDDFISVTSFCNALQCLNAPNLSKKLVDLTFEFSNPAMAVGSIIHKVIQKCLVSKKNDGLDIIKETKNVIKENLFYIYSCQITDKEILCQVMKFIRQIQEFLSKGYIIDDVELQVYSKVFSLKGAIDCLNQDYLFEIKAGKEAKVEHKAQAILYFLIYSDHKSQRIRFSEPFSLASNLEAVSNSNDKSKEIILNRNENPNSNLSLQSKIDSIKNKNSNCLEMSNNLEDISVTAVNNIETNLIQRPNSSDTEKQVKNEIIIQPMLYYVQKQEILPVQIKHSEILSLLILRNKITINKEIEKCNCTDTSPCKIYNKIKNFDNNNFLRQQLEAIEEEEKGNSLILSAQVLEYHKVQKSCIYFLRIRGSVEEGTYVNILNKRGLFKVKGIIESIENDKSKVSLFEDIILESSVLLEVDNSSTFFKFMYWSLINVAYSMYSSRKSTFPLPFIETFSYKDRLECRCIEQVHIKDQEDSIENISVSFDSDILVSESNLKDESFKSEISNFEDEIFSDNSNISIAQIQGNISSSEDILKDLIFKDSSEENEKNSSKLKPNADPIQDALASKVVSFSHTSQSLLFQNLPLQQMNTTDSFNYFTQNIQDSLLSFKYFIPEIFMEDFVKLNEDQRSSLFLSLNCEDYKIIHGMPGTGKTTVIALLIKILIHYKMKVLLICYTHMAMDNIISRLGSINYYKAKKSIIEADSTEELKKRIGLIDLVIGSCFSFKDPIYLDRKFDYCIIDEGSQMHFLLTLIPISRAKRFCIVGDHLQLKPLAKKNKILSQSLFEHLISGCSTLKIQYRMADEIMRLSNKLFYNGMLVGCNKKGVVEFVDSSTIGYASFIKSLDKCTILCYFNAQVRETMKYTNNLVTTIDKYQGSESDNVCVVLDPIIDCDIMNSHERLNVALTRAKNKLIIIGNKTEMMRIPILNKLLKILQSEESLFRFNH